MPLTDRWWASGLLLTSSIGLDLGLDAMRARPRLWLQVNGCVDATDGTSGTINLQNGGRGRLTQYEFEYGNGDRDGLDAGFGSDPSRLVRREHSWRFNSARFIPLRPVLAPKSGESIAACYFDTQWYGIKRVLSDVAFQEESMRPQPYNPGPYEGKRWWITDLLSTLAIARGDLQRIRVTYAPWYFFPSIRFSETFALKDLPVAGTCFRTSCESRTLPSCACVL